MWRVHVVKNTFKMDLSLVDEFKAITKEAYHDCDYSKEYGLDLDVHGEANEHIDCFWIPELQELLKHESVNGDIVFADLEGDWKGRIWGYRFTNGVRVNLVGDIVLEEFEF